jgi:hypothetical protein
MEQEQHRELAESILALLAEVEASRQRETLPLRPCVSELCQFGLGAHDVTECCPTEQEEAAYQRGLEASRERWQSMETAPKDGRTLLLFREITPWRVIGYGRWVDEFGGGWVSYGFFGPEYDGSNLGLAAPTHWMPLPAPPEEDRP